LIDVLDRLDSHRVRMPSIGGNHPDRLSGH
jgi:hypothetical protein